MAFILSTSSISNAIFKCPSSTTLKKFNKDAGNFLLKCSTSIIVDAVLDINRLGLTVFNNNFNA